MKFSNRSNTALTAMAATMFLSGCLSSGSDDADSGFNGEQPQPPPSGNSAPTISGNPPAAVTVGDSYSFTPSASDPDGDTLTFSIQNQPTWASFDTQTGRVSGDPSLGDIGSYTNISITVSDGQVSASTNNFTIDVTQVALLSTTLSWAAPTQNEDGTALTDLAGYKIFYGTSSRNYTNEILIDNPSITTYVVENLSPNTYYFAAKAINLDDIESQFSGEAIKILN